jgi:hypothetical protein
MNSNNSGSTTEVIKDTNSITKGINPTIKRRKLFIYLAAGAASVYALTKMPFNIFKQKVAHASKITVKENPYAVKRENGSSSISGTRNADARKTGVNNG